MTVFIVNHY